jgi:hypothetical protein
VTAAEYKARIRSMGFTPHSPSRGEHSIHVWRDGELYPIKDPDKLSPEQRVDQIRKYEQQFAG